MSWKADGVYTAPPSDPIACFIHINKNAGTSLRSLIASNYCEREVYAAIIQGRASVGAGTKTIGGPDEDVHEVVSDIQAQEGHIACVAANLPYGLHEYLLHRVVYFAFLREPINRCESYWHHAYRLRAEGGLWSTLENYGLNLDAALSAGAAYQFSNDQVRMISGSSAAYIGLDQYELARYNVQQHFAFVGAVERFNACVGELARRLQWKDATARHLNAATASERGPLPTRTARIFRDANEWDARLHQWLIRDYLPRNL